MTPSIVPPVNPFYNPISSSSRSTRSNALWVDPFTAPAYPSAGDTSKIRGNAPTCIKQLTLNTFGAYTVQPEGSFAHSVAKNIRFAEMDVMEQDGIGRQGRTVAEIIVSKDMLNGKGMIHGGCLAYLVDVCACTPLIVLGLVEAKNGVGVTQNLNVNYHAPASLGTCLRIISTSITLGARVMSARCDILDKVSGRIVASASMNRMQPQRVRL